MKKLFLLRHAQAVSSLMSEDKERSLTEKGLAQANKIGRALLEGFEGEDNFISMALCSSAVRTKTTLKKVENAGVVFKKINLMDSLYNAPAGDLLKAVQEAGNVDSLLVVAHNPGIHQLVNILVGSGAAQDLERVSLSYRPATLSILECEIDNWADIQPHANKLSALILPD